MTLITMIHLEAQRKKRKGTKLLPTHMIITEKYPWKENGAYAVRRRDNATSGSSEVPPHPQHTITTLHYYTMITMKAMKVMKWMNILGWKVRRINAVEKRENATSF